MKKILVSIRFLLFIIISLIYIFVGYVFSFISRKKSLEILKLRRLYVIVICFVLGIKIKVKNVPKMQSFILIVNHRTYLDPVVIAKDLLMFPLAKFEVSKWPLIGWGAKLSGGFFVKRENKNSREKASDKIIEFVKNNKIVMICPEGTTHTNAQTIAFRPRTFINAAKHNIAIIPTAIEYGKKEDAWVGEDTFVRHFFECFGKWQTNVILSYGKAIKNEDWEVLLKETKSWIDDEMLLLRKELGYKV